jgi:glycosyltransferase involved in cell wall biosynthesis
MSKREGMLLVLPVPFHIADNRLFFESQACNGLERWADNFGFLIVAAPVLPESLVKKNKTMTWRDTATLENPHRFEFVPLPWATSFPDFVSRYLKLRTNLNQIIKQCQYLQFAIGSSIGDWAAIAALEAQKQNKPYAIHTDLVHHEFILRNSKRGRLLRQLKARVRSPILATYHRWIFRRSALGLLHGADCYFAYKAFCKHSYLIHNIHTKPSDCISEQELAKKAVGVTSEQALRICYAGRLEPEKAPIDWLKAIARARSLGVNLHATWMGEGSLFEEMKHKIVEYGLRSCVELTGFETDRHTVLKRIRESHLMVFTNITPESPRCLIEALICGTPIVGYRSYFAEDLVRSGGGAFVPMGDWKKLGNLIASLAADRQRLMELVLQAGKSGTPFNDEEVFRERSNLIKKHLA